MNVLQEIKVPLLSVNDQTLVIQELAFKSGDRVRKGEVVALLETSKTVYTIEAEAEGYISYHCKAGDELPVNELIATISATQIADVALPNQINGKAHLFLTNGENKQLKKAAHTIFSNQAKKLLEDLKLSEADFAGYDFVNAADVRKKTDPNYRNKQDVAPKEKSNPKEVIIQNKDEVEVVKLSSNKLREIDYLSSVQSSGLISVIHMDVETDYVFPMIQANMRYFKDSLLPIIVYEAARLLRKYPEFNAYYANQSTAFYKNVHVGFAIDMGLGLKVARIQHTDQRQVYEIEDEIVRLSGAYLDNQLQIEDITDVTFTITDLSAENVAFFHPLVNMKNAAILGISAIDKKLNRCTLSLSFDHRVTEGKKAATFLADLKSRIESFSNNFIQDGIKNERLNSIICHRCTKTLAEDKSSVGFVQCITDKGEPGYICQACLKGF